MIPQWVAQGAVAESVEEADLEVKVEAVAPVAREGPVSHSVLTALMAALAPAVRVASAAAAGSVAMVVREAEEVCIFPRGPLA